MNTRFRDPDIDNPRFESRLVLVKGFLTVLLIIAAALFIFHGCGSDTVSATSSIDPTPQYVPVRVLGVADEERRLKLRIDSFIVYMDPWIAAELGLTSLDGTVSE
jgi:hypothetical protein